MAAGAGWGVMDESESVETNAGYRELGAAWHCPVCWRQKADIVRRTKTGRLKAFAVIHHDHFADHAAQSLAKAADDQGLPPQRRLRLYTTMRHFVAWLTAFDPVTICEMCNHAEAIAKRIVGAPSHFSFGPVAMRSFVQGDGLNPDAAREQWRNAKLPLGMREYHLQGMINKSMAGAAWREMAPNFRGDTRHWHKLFEAMASDDAVDEMIQYVRIGKR